MLVSRSQTFLPFFVSVRLREPDDVVGLRIDSDYASRPRFTKLEQGSKAAVIVRVLIRVSPVLRLSSVQSDLPARIPAQ